MKKLSILLVASVVAFAATGCEFPYPGDYVPDAGPTTCANSRLDDGEQCDGALLGDASCFSTGHVAGTLGCTSMCTFDFSGCFDCGNAAVDGPEVCDGAALGGTTCESRGHDGGTLRCAPDCMAFDESACTDCGDMMREGAEVCDGPDRGGETCVTLGFVGGTLACNANCAMFDTSGCNSTLPTVPKLRLPMNDAYVGSVHVSDSLRPRFSWEPSTWGGAGTVSYELQLSADPAFAMGVTTVPTAATEHRPAADLPVRMVAPVGTRYFWRVRACVGATCSAYSAAWKVNLGRSDRDLNGDGFADIAVGAPLNDAGGGDAGRVYLYFGGPGATLDPTVDGTLTGVAGETFGSSVAIVADLNGDGFADLVVGAPANGAGGASAGRAYVYYGAAGATFDTGVDGTLTGTSTQDEFGKSVASAGDVNGDGFADLVVGANQTPSASGRAYLFFGGPGAFDPTSDATLRGQVNGDFFGYAVAGAGDTNGDGFADVLVGAFLHGSGSGSAYVFLGRSGAFETTADGTVSGVAANDWLGISVASAGDVNGDGFADVIVGAEGNDAGGIGAGQAYVYYGGASDTLDATPDGTLTGAAAGDTFGRSVAGASDVNGDGFSDVVVGAFLADGGVADTGRAYVYLGGATATFNAVTDGALSGSAVVDDKFGQSVAGAGDLNGDGFADVIVGAPGNDTAAMNAGRSYAYFGAAGAAFNTTVDGSPSGVTANDFFGQAVH